MTKKRCIQCLGDFKADTENFHSDGGDRLRARCRACENAKRTGRAITPTRAKFTTKVKQAQRYVITYAQNATPIHLEFFAALEQYCRHNDAKLLIIPGRYKNPTSVWTQHMEDDEWWATETHPYLFSGRHDIGSNLTVYGDVMIQPTAVRPLSGFEVFAGESSAIFGHPKIQLQTVATATRTARVLTTTGAVTISNYTDSKAGKKGDAHHIFGATIVERSGKQFHIRQINAEDEDGSFYDLNKRYDANGVYDAEPAAALVCGDIHVEKCDRNILEATLYADDSIAAVLKPKYIIYHDVLDFDARNHHHINDPFDRYSRVTGRKVDRVEDELKRVVAFLDATPAYAVPVVIASNHDEAFDKWLRSTDARHDLINARLYHQMWAALIEEYDRTGIWVPALELYCRLVGHTRSVFVRRNQEFKVGDIALNLHGDKGLNGARSAGVTSYVRLGVKSVIGHSHTPAILDGCYQTGTTGRLDQGYNTLPSGWALGHCLITNNCKRTLIFVQENGDWHLPENKTNVLTLKNAK